MADAPQIHPLRQRMIEDMTLRGINSTSQRTYLRAVRTCCISLRRKPAELTAEDARSFHASALRFFLRVTLGASADIDRVPIIKERRALPAVLTPEEVARIIAAAPGLKYSTAIGVTYGAGLRASETVARRLP